MKQLTVAPASAPAVQTGHDIFAGTEAGAGGIPSHALSREWREGLKRDVCTPQRVTGRNGRMRSACVADLFSVKDMAIVVAGGLGQLGTQFSQSLAAGDKVVASDEERTPALAEHGKI
jgi:hypothetical protein